MSNFERWITPLLAVFIAASLALVYLDSGSWMATGNALVAVVLAFVLGHDHAIQVI